MHAANGADEEARDEGVDGREASMHEVSAREPGAVPAESLVARLVELDRATRRRLAWLGGDPLRRERAVDRATEIMLRRMLRGDPPEQPCAWFCRVVDRLIGSKKIRCAPEHLSHDAIWDLAVVPGAADRPEPSRREEQAAWLREEPKKDCAHREGARDPACGVGPQFQARRSQELADGLLELPSSAREVGEEDRTRNPCRVRRE